MKRKIVLACLLPILAGIPLVLDLRAQDKAQHQAASGSGTIEGTEIRLSSRVGARVLSAAVQRGDAVQSGQLLVSLDCSDARAAVAEAEARVQAARAQVEAAESQAETSARTRIVLSASSDASRAQVSSLRTQQGVSSRQADRLERLGEDASQAARDQMRSQAEGLQHEADAAQAQSRSLAAQVRAADSSWRAAQAQTEAARRSVTAAEASAARARLLADECEIRAPRAALVDEVFVEPGEQASAGATLVRLVDLDLVKATFYLPNVELRAARPGGAALIAADPWPGVEFAGSVVSVGSSAEFTPRNIQTRTDRDRLVFPIEVRIPNPKHELRPGMPVQVTLPGTEL